MRFLGVGSTLIHSLPVKDQRLRSLELLEIVFTRMSKSCNLLFLLQPFCKIQSFSFCNAFNSLMVLSFIGTTCNGGQQNRMALPTREEAAGQVSLSACLTYGKGIDEFYVFGAEKITLKRNVYYIHIIIY